MTKCMESLLEQDIPGEEYEIIMVDDCSPDNSLEMANTYAAWSRGESSLPITYRLSPIAQRPSIKVLHHGVNKGLAAGRNTGVDAAEGQYICFVDPDDYIEKNSLAALLKQMDDEQLDMLRFNYQKVDENYNYLPDLPAEQEFGYTPGVMTGKEFLANRLGIACYVWAYIFRTSLIKGDNGRFWAIGGEGDSIAHSLLPIAFIEGCRIDDSPWLPRVLQRAQRVACATTPLASRLSPLASHCPRHLYYLQRQGSLVHVVREKEAVLKKLQGCFQLMDIMLPHMQEAATDCQGWYRRFISYTAFSMLADIVYLPKDDAWKIIDELRQRGCFPLTNRTYKRSAAIRKLLMNINPKLYWYILHS